MMGLFGLVSAMRPIIERTCYATIDLAPAQEEERSDARSLFLEILSGNIY